MYQKKYFWIIGIITGFFSGMFIFLIQLGILHFSSESFSLFYLIIYIAPLFVMGFACIRLRDRYGQNILEFKQGFGLSVLTGFISAIIMSLMIYFIYTYFLLPSLEHRVMVLESEILAGNPSQTMDEITEKKQLIQKLLTPLSLAVYYFVINLILLPVYALIIAIFARRRNRYID